MNANRINPSFPAVMFDAETLYPDAVSSKTATIKAGARAVTISTVVNDANDWITLPPIASVPLGHEIIILCNAGGNFELRTPASSNTKINNEDGDGTKEYLCTDTEVVRAISMGATAGWCVYSFTKLGAKTTAVVPD